MDIRFNNMKKGYIYLIITFLFIILNLISCDNRDKNKSNNTSNYTYIAEQGEIFHTTYHIKYYYKESLQFEILEVLNRFDMSLNPFNQKSIISKVNRNELTQVDSMFIKVFNKSMDVSRKSDGKFDITASPLINAWGFGFSNMENITKQTIDSLMEFVGYNKIVLSGNKIEKTDPRIQLNTSAISKGYSCDLVAYFLDSYGIENYMIEIGGEIVTKGVNDKGECWHIGIDKPVEDNSAAKRELQVILSLCNKSLATSGNYRNYYIKDGKKYAHTIDPQTGYPTQNDMLSATVIANDCMTADAYATAFMASGSEKSKEIAQKEPGLEYFFIYTKPDQTMGITYSKGFEQFFTK